MKKTNTLFLLALTVIFLGSCTVERRLHNKGFHVQWSKKYKAKNVKAYEAQDLAVQSEQDEEVQQTLQLKPVSSLTSSSDQENQIAEFRYEADDSEIEESIYDQSPVNELSTTSNSLESSMELAAVETSSDQVVKKSSKKSKRSAAASSGKSQMVALLLVIFVGIIGVHRFYLGYTGVGVLMVLTLGLFGILTLIDLIRIAVGDLKPKRGEYGETFEDL
jgi:TM2 domain-containing membrane protein YozV